MEQKETVILVSEILDECKRKLWFILISVCIFAVLFGGYKFYKDMSAINVEEKKQSVSNPNEIYSEEELVQIEKYIDALTKYESMKEYVEKSLYMKLDYSKVATANMQFLIEASNETQVPDIIIFLSNFVNNGDLTELISQSNSEINAFYLQELISGTVHKFNDGTVSKVFSIKIWGQNEAVCKYYVTLVENALQKATEQNQFASFKINKISSNILITNNSNIYSTQVEKSNMLTTLVNRLQTIGDQLSDAQKLTVQAIINENAEAEDDVVNNEVLVSVDLKFVILGAVIGVFFAICIIYMLYYFDDTIKNSRDIEKRFHLYCLGKERENEDLIVARIVGLSKKNVDKNISMELLGNISDEKIKKYFKSLKENGIEVSIIQDVLKNKKSIIDSFECKNVVVVLKCRRTKYSDIEEWINFCKLQDKNIIGCILT